MSMVEYDSIQICNYKPDIKPKKILSILYFLNSFVHKPLWGRVIFHYQCFSEITENANKICTFIHIYIYAYIHTYINLYVCYFPLSFFDDNSSSFSLSSLSSSFSLASPFPSYLVFPKQCISK